MSVSPIWPAGSAVNAEGEITFHGRTAESLLDEFGSPLYVIDTDEVRDRATKFVHSAANAFNNTVTHVSFAGKALLSKEICRIVTESGMLIDTCSMGEMRIALAAGVPGRRLVLHGNNKSDAEIELAIEQGFNKIVIDEPDEPARIAAIAKRLGKRARVMLRVTSGIHAGGHEFVSTAHEDQKFGVALLPAGADTAKLGVLDDLTDVTPAGSNARLGENAADAADQAAHAGHAERKLQYDVKYPYDLSHEKVSEGDRRLAEAMTMVADGPALAVLKDIYRRQDVLELVGVHSHIGSNIHDADAFIQAAKRMMLLRKTFYATDAYTLPEVDLGGGYSVAYTDGEDSMDVRVASFGFKYGLPLEADLVFDVRFLPNPYYIPELKHQTGLDEPVRSFVFKYQQTLDFVTKTEDLLSFLLPNYLDEGKTDLVIAVGCTGGKHRSVCIAKELFEFVSKKGYAATLSHRDMGRR